MLIIAKKILINKKIKNNEKYLEGCEQVTYDIRIDRE